MYNYKGLQSQKTLIWRKIKTFQVRYK